jgi:hypothetical protein
VFCSTRTSSGSGWCSLDPLELWSVFFCLLFCVVCLFFLFFGRKSPVALLVLELTVLRVPSVFCFVWQCLVKFYF